MTFRPLLAGLLALVLVTAGCLGTVQEADAAGSRQADAPEGPTISVSTTASVEGEPDLAVVRVAVEATADGADAARQRVATDADAVRAALADAGIPADAVTTTGFAVHVQYDYTGEERTVAGYRAVHSFAVEVRDVDRAGEVVDVAVGNGATRVDGVRFTLVDETRETLRERALTGAMAAARADADTMAAASGLSVTGVHSASTSGDSPGPYPGPVFAERDAAGGTTFGPGTVTVSASVTVVYTAAKN